MINHRLTSLSSEHYTPPEIVEAARETMGGIDLDPASCLKANRYIKAKRYFTQKDNGYLRDWHGKVFLNPPGGWCDNQGQTVVKGKMGKHKKRLPDCTVTGACGLKPGHLHVGRQSSQVAWWFKLAEEYHLGHVQEAIFVCFSIDLLQTSQCYVPRVNAIHKEKFALPMDFPFFLPATRLAYLHEDEQGKLVVGSQPTHASMIVYLPPKKASHKKPPLVAPKRKQRIHTPFEHTFPLHVGGRVVCPA
jgi:hypothetical protein